MLCNWPQIVCTSVYIFMACSFIESKRVASTTTRTTTAFTTKLHDILSFHRIIPDVIKQAPDNSLTVKYLNGLKPSFGNIYSPNEVQNAPYFIRWPCHYNWTYSLIMTDPDVPSRENPVDREYRHWLVVNIHGPNLFTGDVITKYRGPKPAPGSGSHRYVFLLYRQPLGRIDFSDAYIQYHDTENERRRNFSTKRFVKKYKLGHPVAINFFVCSNENES